jgi:flagellar biosynthesis protein FliQ
MMMMNKLKTFLASEAGAVTVDWVVLTAAVVGLAAGATVEIQSAATDVNSSTGSYIANRPVGE